MRDRGEELILLTVEIAQRADVLEHRDAPGRMARPSLNGALFTRIGTSWPVTEFVMTSCSPRTTSLWNTARANGYPTGCRRHRRRAGLPGAPSTIVPTDSGTVPMISAAAALLRYTRPVASAIRMASGMTSTTWRRRARPYSASARAACSCTRSSARMLAVIVLSTMPMLSPSWSRKASGCR